MKKLILPAVSFIPRLVEYTYSTDEESDIDKFQMRKCINFKKMILEALKPGDGVGVPVPVAYDDILVRRYSSSLTCSFLLVANYCL